MPQPGGYVEKYLPKSPQRPSSPHRQPSSICPNKGATLEKYSPRAHSDRRAHSDSQQHMPQPGGYCEKYHPEQPTATAETRGTIL